MAGQINKDNSAILLAKMLLVNKVLKEWGMRYEDNPERVPVVLFTMMFPTVLQKLFKKRPLSHVNPDEAVALGAAIQSAKANESYATLAVQVVDGKKTTDRTKTGLSSHVSVRAEKKINSMSML